MRSKRSPKQRRTDKKSPAAKAGARVSPPRKHAQKPARKASGPGPRRKSPGRTPSPDDRLSRAVGLAENGKIKQALKAAEGILASHPEHWRTLHFTSSLLMRADQMEGALAFAKRAFVHAPDNAEIRHQLAMNIVACADRLSRPEDAISACQEFLDRYEPSAGLLSTLSALQIRARRPSDGLKTADKGIALFPDNVTLHHNRSGALFHLGRVEEAADAFGRILRPLVSDPGDTTAEVVSHYAALAEGYDDNRLHQIYGRLMAQLIVQTVGATVAKRVLDAGCGTGALGANIRTARLVGIDLSPDMLAKARVKNLYHDLVEGDLPTVMAQRTDRFDIIAAAVVLYHTPDLGPFFREAARLLVTGGHLFFSVDPAPDSMDIGITGPGEYAHSRAYVRRLAAETGFAETTIKIMPHRGNPGFWCAFRRT